MPVSNPGVGTSVTTAEIEDEQVTTAKLADGAVTRAKTSGIEVDADTQALAHSTTVGDYNQPTTAVATNEGDVVGGDLDATSRDHDNSGASTVNDNQFNVDDSSFTIPTDDFEIRFPLNVTAFTARGDTNAQDGFVGLVAGNNIVSAAVDRIGIYYRTHTTAGNKFYLCHSDGVTADNAAAITDIADYGLQTGQIYVKIVLSATNTLTATFYSDSAYSIVLATVSKDITALTISGLTHWVHSRRRTVATNNGVVQFTVPNVPVISGISKTKTAVMAVDDDSNEWWQADAAIAAAIYVDMNGLVEMAGVNVNPHSNITETEIKIRVSATTTFTDAGLVRTILVSALTTGSDNFIRFNRPDTTMRYLQIIGSSGLSLVMAITEIAVRTETESVMNRGQRNYYIDPTDTTLDLDGSPA